MCVTAGYTLAMFVGVGLMWLDFAHSGLSVAIGAASGGAIFLLGALLSFLTRSKSEQTMAQWFNVWVFAGTRNLRRTFQVPLFCLHSLHFFGSHCISCEHYQADFELCNESCACASV
jgi:hypothetical protein